MTTLRKLETFDVSQNDADLQASPPQVNLSPNSQNAFIGQDSTGKFWINGVQSGGSAGPIIPANLPDPTAFQWFYDDFVGGVSVAASAAIFPSQLPWTTSIVGSGTVSILAPADAGTSGVLKLTTGATNGNVSGVFTGAGGTNTTLTTINDKTFDLKMRLKINTISTITAQFGFSDSISNTAWIRFLAGTDSTWTAQCLKAGVSTLATITGSTLDTNYHDFRIRSTTPGIFLFSVDGGIEVSIGGSNIPLTNMSLNFILTTNTTAAESMFVDYVWGWIAITR